ncbi:type VII secretion protein EccE [Micromonospora sp. R77]|uniref:type VII secretion protein EccE n=1 Tax=Micromonospora sp. R77 TaxID=2925836 RepID=UPI001F603343|nr:type VII secretion protein EccE [Micromonospora sp. R77]MCI4065051.1 type VII secretion protein EccE [Micromonospora sp. R77]
MALLLVTLAFARRRNRWWLEDRVIAWRYRRRRGGGRRRRGRAGARRVAYGGARPDRPQVSAPDGARVGVARDDAGWFSVVALTPTAPVHADGAPVPLDALVGVLAATEQPGVVLQLVNQTVPAPSLDVPSASPAGASYQQLSNALSPIAVPAHRESSVSVRIDARSLAEALLDHTADAEAAAALVASLGRRVATSLRRLGIACRVLDTRDLVAALARSCDVEPGGDGSPVREEWTRWHSAQLVHRTFWLRTWPASTGAIGALFDRVAATPAAQTSMALVLDPAGGDDVAVRALIRLAARPDDDIAALERALTEGVRRLGGDLQPLDGEQGPAAYATAPTGGGAG